jgi:hypothetical protein
VKKGGQHLPRCYGEHVGVHIGNLGNSLGTQREFSGNQGKMKKNWEPK